MNYDLEKPFGELYNGGSQFKRYFLKAVSMQYDREDTPVWTKNLQFLTVCPSENTLPNTGKGICYDAPSTAHNYFSSGLFLPKALAQNRGATKQCGTGQPCHCASYPGFDSISRKPGERMNLRLTAPGEMPGCTHYLAISYRWLQDKISEEERYDIVLPSNKRRQSNVPAWLLDRIIAYAASQGFKLIWIDQECVDQNNEADLAQAVGSYHAVYRRSQQVLAVLTSEITEQAHLDAFKFAEKYYLERAQTGTLKIKGSELRSIMQVSTLISKNQWFDRIWTLSESLMASRPLHFLVPCGRSLQRSLWLGNISGQIVVNQLVLQVFFCPLIKPYTGMFSERVQRPKEKNINRVLSFERGAITAYHNFQETCPESKWSLKRKRNLTALEACRFLSNRSCFQNSDRIVIMANVCGYKKALRCPKLIQPKLGLSICTLALSVINGDNNLLEYIQMEPWVGRLEAFSWLPLPASSVKDAIDSNRTSNNMLGSWVYPIVNFPCESITSKGMLTFGYLWPMTCHIKTTNIICKADEIVDQLYSGRMSKRAQTKARASEIVNQISILAGKDRARHLYKELPYGFSPSDTNGPLSFLEEHDGASEDQTSLYFSEIVGSCCLFTKVYEIEDLVDYIFVPYSSSMFTQNGSHSTVALAWNVRIMDRPAVGSNEPLRLRYLGLLDEELYLLGSPKRVESIAPQRFLLK